MNTINLPPTKYFRLFSDVHLDMNVPKKFSMTSLWFPEQKETDLSTTLILAGDIWHAKKMYSFHNQSWIKELASRFQYVLFVLGNHDFWGGNLSKEYLRAEKELKKQNIDNVYLLQNSIVNIGDIKIIGATLWTDLLNGDRELVIDATKIMNDYKYIQVGEGYTTLKPHHIMAEHVKSKDFIFTNAKKDYETQKVWVVTHHAPSFQSVNISHYANTPLTNKEHGLDASNLEELILNSEIDLWMHGHTHLALNYSIGNTQVLSNPKGYPNEDTLYDKDMLICVEENPVIKHKIK